MFRLLLRQCAAHILTVSEQHPSELPVYGVVKSLVRLRHVAGTQWGNKKYMNMKHSETALEDVSIVG